MEQLKKVLGWLFHSLLAWGGHAAGAAAVLFLWTLVKSIRDSNALSYYWEHPGELLSPAIVAILASACVAMIRIVLRQRRTLASFGVRLFSMHDSPEVKKSDWAALKKDIERASLERSPLWILGATGKETFAGSTAPLFDTLRAYEGEIKILLVRPKSFAFEHRCQDLGVAEERYLNEILDSIDYCKDLQSRTGRSVELKLYEALPIWKMVLTTRVLWVQFYKPGTHVDQTPMYCFEFGGEHSTLFDGFRAVFKKRWLHDGSHVVDLKKFIRSAWEHGC